VLGFGRISTNRLSLLCRELAISLTSGIDIRRIWERLAQRSRGRAKEVYAHVAQQVATGETLFDSIQETGDFFPPLFRQLVEAGEHTGLLAEVFRRLAEHYEHQVQLSKTFWRAMTAPALRVIAAILAVGVLIYAPEFSSSKPSEQIDLLGFGIKGTSGLILYAFAVGLASGVLLLLVLMLRSGKLWGKSMQRILTVIPPISQVVQPMALSRFTWTLHLGIDAGANLENSLRMAFDSTQNEYYRRHFKPVWERIVDGADLHEALAATDIFPHRVLDAVEIGERAGNLSETLSRTAETYHTDAQAAMVFATKLVGGIIWAATAILIGGIVVRFYSNYFAQIDKMTRM
jgi:type IV pilus assembly protein PilC